MCCGDFGMVDFGDPRRNRHDILYYQNLCARERNLSTLCLMYFYGIRELFIDFTRIFAS